MKVLDSDLGSLMRSHAHRSPQTLLLTFLPPSICWSTTVCHRETSNHDKGEGGTYGEGSGKKRKEMALDSMMDGCHNQHGSHVSYQQQHRLAVYQCQQEQG